MIIPKHNNTDKANQIFYWSGSDKKSCWEKNLKDNYQFFLENNWIHENSIEYSYNSHGFRCEEFNDKPCYLAIGCSFTEGVGLNKNQTWPVILSNMVGYPVLNLGVGGSSLDTCFRILDFYIGKLNVLGVFLLEVSPDRFEIFNNNEPFVYVPQHIGISGDKVYELYKYWVLDENNSINIRNKNIYAMKYLCNKHNVPFVSHSAYNTEEYTNNCDYSRDMAHPGLKSMINHATLFYKNLNTYYG